MKFLAFLLPSLFALSVFFMACGKIDLPSTDDEKTDTTSTDTIDNDSPNVVPAGTDTLTVAEVLCDTTERYVLVRGYIVGYLKNSQSNYYFGLPTEENTNMIIADSPDETDVANCLAVALLSGTDFRDEVNLYDHPENYKRRILLYGKIVEYFDIGMKPVTAYSWCTTDNSSTDEPDDPDTPDNPDDGSDVPNTPTIDPTPSDSIDGR